MTRFYVSQAAAKRIAKRIVTENRSSLRLDDILKMIREEDISDSYSCLAELRREWRDCGYGDLADWLADQGLEGYMLKSSTLAGLQSTLGSFLLAGLEDPTTRQIVKEILADD